tara:strand:- start:101 stop:592 length:492 start_codon:yes stop_codon:yes gene_type:complete
MSKTQIATGGIADDAVTAAKATGFGKVGQIVTTTFTMDQDITSTSLTELNSSCRVAITPQASGSKILYFCSFPFFSNSANTGFFMNIYKDVGGGGYGDDSGEISRYSGYQSSTGNYDVASWHYLSSPSTTSAVTYTPYVKVSGNTVNFGNNAKFNATVLEILA